MSTTDVQTTGKDCDNPRATAVFLFLLFIAGFLIRLWGMSKLHFWDEMVYLRNAQVICCHKINYSELDFRPPLLSLIFALVFLVWNHIYAACITAACMNALAPVFLFFAGRLSVGRLPAIIASVLLAFSPFFVGVFPNGFDSDDTGNSLLTDSPALMLILLALWLLLRALRQPTVFRYFAAGFVLALSILMRFGSLPSVCLLLLLPLADRDRIKAIAASISGLAVGIAPYLIWSKFTYGGFLFTLQAGWSHVEGPAPPFTFFLKNAPAIFTPIAIFGVLLSIAAPLLRSPSTRDSGAASRFVEIYLWLWLIVGLLFFSSMPHKEPRYILPLAPPVLLLAGSGLSLFSTLRTKTLRTACAVALAASLFMTFLPLRERFAQPFINRISPDEELASQFLASTVPANTTLYMSFNYPAFAFFSNFKIHELESVGPDLYRDMEQIPPNEVLIVYRAAESPSQSDIAWIDSNPKFERLKEFASFVVYRSKS